MCINKRKVFILHLSSIFSECVESMSGRRLLSPMANSKEVTNLSAKLHKCWELDIDWTIIPDKLKEVSIITVTINMAY